MTTPIPCLSLEPRSSHHRSVCEEWRRVITALRDMNKRTAELHRALPHPDLITIEHAEYREKLYGKMLSIKSEWPTDIEYFTKILDRATNTSLHKVREGVITRLKFELGQAADVVRSRCHAETIARIDALKDWSAYRVSLARTMPQSAAGSGSWERGSWQDVEKLATAMCWDGRESECTVHIYDKHSHVQVLVFHMWFPFDAEIVAERRARIEQLEQAQRRFRECKKSSERERAAAPVLRPAPSPLDAVGALLEQRARGDQALKSLKRDLGMGEEKTTEELVAELRVRLNAPEGAKCFPLGDSTSAPSNVAAAARWHAISEEHQAKIRAFEQIAKAVGLWEGAAPKDVIAAVTAAADDGVRAAFRQIETMISSAKMSPGYIAGYVRVLLVGQLLVSEGNWVGRDVLLRVGGAYLHVPNALLEPDGRIRRKSEYAFGPISGPLECDLWRELRAGPMTPQRFFLEERMSELWTLNVPPDVGAQFSIPLKRQFWIWREPDDEMVLQALAESFEPEIVNLAKSNVMFVDPNEKTITINPCWSAPK